MVFKIDVKVTPRMMSFLQRFEAFFLGLDRLRTITNRRLANQAAKIIVKAMKGAGIKSRTGRLFDSVKPVGIGKEGFSVKMDKLAAILHFGRPDGYEIRSKQPHELLADPSTGFLVSTKLEPIIHRVEPRPWFETAENELFDFLGSRYIVAVTKVITRTTRK